MFNKKKRMPKVDPPKREPMFDPNMINKAFEKLSEEDFDSIVSMISNGDTHLFIGMDFAKGESESVTVPIIINPGSNHAEIFSWDPKRGFISPLLETKEKEEEEKKVQLANDIVNHFFELGARVGYSDLEYVKERL